MSAAIYPNPPQNSTVAATAPSYVNPAQMQSSQAGPSSPPLSKKKLPSASKRKRTDTPEDSNTEFTTPARKAREGPKKKKANRACFHCQKAHLTCDDSRPCQRCIKRGIANNCTEGHRKKAKYLLDDEELGRISMALSSSPPITCSTEELKRSKSTASARGSSSETPQVTSAPPLSTDAFSQNDSVITNSSFDPSFAFTSEAASLEYSILSAILGNPSPAASETSPPPQQSQFASWASDSIDYATSPRLSNYGPSYSDPQLSSMQPESALTASSGNQPYLTYGYTQQRPDDMELQYTSQYSANQASESTDTLQSQRYPLDAITRSSSIDAYNPARAAPASGTGLLSPAPSSSSPTTTSPIPPGLADLPRSELQSINDSVTKPYDYTEGYHFLMKYLPKR